MRVLFPLGTLGRLAWAALLLLPVGISAVYADNVQLQNGLLLRGEIGVTSEIGELAQEFGENQGKIIIVDDGLRRVFVSRDQARNIVSEPISQDIIRIEQPTTNVSEVIRGVGRPLDVRPFDSWGRRRITLAGPEGPRHYYQGITKITSSYCVLETLTAEAFNAQWESRIATSSVPREVLSSVIRGSIDESNPNERIKVVQLYIEAERYQDAVLELEEFLEDFPDITDRQPLADLLRQSYARQILRELKLRNDVGQPTQAQRMIRQFPTSGIAGALLGELLEAQQEFDRLDEQINTISTKLQALVDQCRQGDTLDEDQKQALSEIAAEILQDLRYSNVERLAGFYQFRDDDSLTIDQRLAYAVSGWLLGEADMAGNLQVTLTHVKTRALVREYLAAQLPHERTPLLEEIEGQEGASVDAIAKIVAHLIPEWGRITSELKETEIPGCFEVSVEGERPMKYWVQLPPEYDPYRRYPCIVTLNGDRTELQQLDWWAGAYSPELRQDQRLGQATRHGYIVIAPMWKRDNQWNYDYSPVAHARVLDSVRDAFRRFAIDSDRVFLSGHSTGGDAAWDIALSHPDLWAGLIPIAASADRYVNHYFTNGSGSLPMYFVHGEYDHARMSANKMDWNRYFRARDADVMVVTYQGRGHEHFQEEILNLFDWMQVHRRVSTPTEMEVKTMRPWDNFFWWVEAYDFPQSTMVLPAEWPAEDRSAGSIEARLEVSKNLVMISQCSGSRVTVWLKPDMVNFDEPIEIRFKTKRERGIIAPSAEVLLEDVRGRGDRQHPYWAKWEGN